MGLPFYARDMRTGDWTTYEDIVKKHAGGGCGTVHGVVHCYVINIPIPVFQVSAFFMIANIFGSCDRCIGGDR